MPGPQPIEPLYIAIGQRIAALRGPHGLRGTHATVARQAGATPELVAATLGHASPAITTGGAYIDKREAEAADRRRAWKVLEGGQK